MTARGDEDKAPTRHYQCDASLLTTYSAVSLPSPVKLAHYRRHAPGSQCKGRKCCQKIVVATIHPITFFSADKIMDVWRRNVSGLRDGRGCFCCCLRQHLAAEMEEWRVCLLSSVQKRMVDRRRVLSVVYVTQQQQRPWRLFTSSGSNWMVKFRQVFGCIKM